MAWKRTVVVFVLASACGPSVGEQDGSQSSDADATSSHDAASDDASGSSEIGGADTTAPADTTGTDVDDCLLADPAACPADCYAGFALQVIDDACGTSSVEACLPGGPKPGLPTSTWWALAPSGPVFLEYGGACGAAARPDAWTECGGATDEPAECACFCHGGYCLGDEDRRALDECELPSDCPVLFVDSEFGTLDHEAERCVLEGLRDRVPGVYEITSTSSFTVDTTRYYVFGSEVARIVLHTDDVIVCPTISSWSAADRCTLQSSEFFADCMMPASTEEECVHLADLWVLDCTTEPPACG